jgi:hypothetical protein
MNGELFWRNARAAAVGIALLGSGELAFGQVTPDNLIQIIQAEKAAAQAQARQIAQQAAQLQLGGQVLIDGNAAPPNAAPRPEPAPASADVLQFLDGTLMHGVLQGMEPGRGLRWLHPDATKPFDLQPDHVDSLQFSHAKQMTNAPTCHFRFFCGDELYGSLVGLTETNLELSTWFGTTMKIPRSAVETISFLPKNYSLEYNGPTDASGWVMGGQQGQVIRQANGANIIIRGGGMIVMNGVIYSGATAGTGTTNWAYHDGSFVSTGFGTLGRDFHLSRSATIDFDATSTGQFNLMMEIYASSLDRIDFGNGAFMLDFDNNPNATARGRSTGVPGDLGNVLLPNLLKEGRAHVTIHCNKEENSITVLVDGKVVKRWTDLAFADYAGGGLFFSSQVPDTMKISNIQVSEWTGKYEPALTPTASTNADEISFINQDTAEGRIGNIGETKLNLAVAGQELAVPLDRVREINFAPTNPLAGVQGGGTWDVRAVFAGGGSVSFRLDKWEGAGVSGSSSLFGPVQFPPESIRELDFNLDRPKTGPTAMEKNEYDALDQ